MAVVPTTQRTQPVETVRPVWQTKAWLEPRLVVITALALAGSMAAAALEAPPALILLLNLTSFAAGGFYGTLGAIERLWHERKVDVDLLMVLAAVGAASIDQWYEGAMLLFLFSLSNVLQDYAIGRSRQAIRTLFKLYPQSARVKRNGALVTVEIRDIRVGEVVEIEPGERIPVDGVVVGGRSAVDQSPITGESLPVDKALGDTVFAGTLNAQGTLDVQATQGASDTTLARIIKMVEEAQDSKAPTERFLEAFEERYAVVILVGTLLFIVVPPLLGLTDFASNFYRAMVLMTVASPCALVISTPASFIAAIASAARSGVLFKGGAFLEGLAAVKAIAFDKTGTLTHGKPAVTDVLSCCEVSDDDLLRVAAAVESRSEHPLAKAIVRAAQARGLAPGEVQDFVAVPGAGVQGTVDGVPVMIGSRRFMEQHSNLPSKLVEASEHLQAQGKTVMLVRRHGMPCAGNCDDCQMQGLSGWMGLVAMADELRAEAVNAIQTLKGLGIQVAMLTGDNQAVAKVIAAQAGVERVYTGLLPDDKVGVIKDLQSTVGPTAMVGDGVNDAPGLATADIGIAMGAAGTDVALETADVVLMGDRLELIAYAIRLSKKARRVVWQNIAFSLAVIVLLITSAFVIALPLPLGVLGHEGSTVIVVLNGLITLLLVPELQRRRSERAAQG